MPRKYVTKMHAKVMLIDINVSECLESLAYSVSRQVIPPPNWKHVPNMQSIMLTDPAGKWMLRNTNKTAEIYNPCKLIILLNS